MVSVYHFIRSGPADQGTDSTGTVLYGGSVFFGVVVYLHLCPDSKRMRLPTRYNKPGKNLQNYKSASRLAGCGVVRLPCTKPDENTLILIYAVFWSGKHFSNRYDPVLPMLFFGLEIS